MFITSNSYPMCHRTSIRPKPGPFKRILIENVIAHMNTRPEPGWFENMIVIQALPESPIEDLTITNMHVITPGGGKKDTGAGVEIPELISMQNYPDMLYPPYPSSCMYIKNAARLRLTNCIFESVNPDERPAIVAEAVDGLLLSGCESYIDGGLLRHYKVDDLRLRNCEGEITTLSPEMAKRWDDFRQMSLEQENQIIKNTSLVDSILTKEKVLSVCPDYSGDTDPSEFEFDYCHNAENAYVTFHAHGSVKIFVNGEEAYEWDRSNICEDYKEDIIVGADISEFIKKGDNKIFIKVTEGGLTGGRRKGVSVYAD